MFGSHEKPQHDAFHEETTTSTSNASRFAIIGLVLVMVAALTWFALARLGGDGDEAASADSCRTTVVEVIAAPAIADLMESAAESLPDNGECIEVNVVAGTVTDVAAAQADVREGDDDALPDLWVPDSPAWQSVLTEAGRKGTVLEPALASSPVGFASGGTDRPASWLEVLGSERLVMSDPNASGAAATALMTPFAEGDSGAAQTALVPLAQQFGDDLSAGVVAAENVDTLKFGSDSLLPVTERDFLIAERGNTALNWVAPKTGVGLLSYPLVQPYAGSGGNGQELYVAARTGARLAEWFTGGDGTAEVAQEQLRGPDGSVLADYADLSTEEQLPAVDKTQVDAVMKSWNSLTVPSSILALVETSESMDAIFGDVTRIQLAVNASKTALSVFPDAVRLGLRSFSTELGPDGEDWVELAPLQRLDARVGKNETQIDLVTKAADSLPGKTSGGAGLYDSILAAYPETQRKYSPYYSNSLVVFTDGPNDDKNSISLQELKRELRALYNPERPVRIILLGLTDSADMESLEEIASTAELSGAFQVLKPEDVLVVLASTLLSRE